MKRWIIFLILLSITGCSFQQIPAVTATPSEVPTLPPSTTTPAPTLTSGPSPTPTVTLTPSPTPFVSFQAKTTVDNVNVRTNPGYLFDVVTVIKQGTFISVLGKSAGGEWINIQASESQNGWVFAKLLQADHDLAAIPVIKPSSVQIVKGKLQDDSGMPVSGIQFSLIQGSGAAIQRNDAVTDENGEFTAFMPQDASGEWTIAYAAIACTSNRMDANCNCKNGTCGSPSPSSQKVTLPFNAIVMFTWR